MVAYSFQKMFAPKILSGAKGQTIRAEGARRHANPGDALQLYQGMRTKHCRLIMRTVCVETSRIRILWSGTPRIDVADVADDIGSNFDAWGIQIKDLDAFAVSDGFDNLDSMRAFWRKHHPGVDRFVGRIVKWKKPAGPVEMGSAIGP